MSQGVFLWVNLVTQSLRNGLLNGDAMEDLNARLKCLPKTLEAFYKQMLDSVDPIYQRKSADLLQMLLIKDLSSLWPGWTISCEMTLLQEREHTNSDYAITMPRTPQTTLEAESFHEQASRRLIAKCRGILEIKPHGVVFIHRTASDYFRTSTMTEYLQTRSGKDFNPKLSLLRAYVGCLKMGVSRITEEPTPVLQNDLYRFNERCFIVALIIAKGAREGGADDTTIFKLVDCLEDLSMMIVDPEEGTYVSRISVWATSIGPLYGPLCLSPFIGSLIMKAEVGYAAKKLSNDVNYFRKMPQPALWLLMVYWMAKFYFFWDASSVKLLRLLLEHGYDPNEVFLAEQENPGLNCLFEPNSRWYELDSSTSSQFFYVSSDFKAHSEWRSIWFDFLISCNISGCLGPRRQVEIALEKHYKTKPLYEMYGYDHDQSFKKSTINSGLERGVYSLLLKHGADPNAHISPFTTVWVDFVCFPIKYSSVIRATDGFLDTLDALFKYGANFGTSVIGLTLNPGDTVSHLPFCMVTGWDTFCEILEDYTASKTEFELEFTAKITTKMIKQAIRIRWPMRRLPSIIETVFPKELHQPMLDLIAESHSRREGPANGEKRPFEETEIVGESKRSKNSSTDVNMS